MKKIYVVIGRFQPLHRGHVAMIRKAIQHAGVNDKVLILVGSSNKCRTPKNPLKYDERKELILKKFGYKVDVRPLPDFDYQDAVWESELHKIVKEYAATQEEQYFIPVFVSGDRGDDPEQRDSWKSGGDTFAVPPFKLPSGTGVSAIDVREHLTTIEEGRIYEDPLLTQLLPLETRQFFEENQDVHQMLIKEKIALDNYKWIWKNAPYIPTFQATDALVVDEEDNILLIERGGNTGKGQFAMAGGYLEVDLTLEQNMKKELLEETNLDLDNCDNTILKSMTFDAVGRSSRGRIITTAFMVKLHGVTIPELIDADILKAGDDASRLAVTTIDSVKKGTVCLYSDHAGIINKLFELNNY